MKLRNKKTGEVVVEINKIGLVWNKYGMPAEIGQYDSIAELNEEWEDYTQKEPLIKDEKIRRCVRLWTEINGFKDKLLYAEFDDCCSFYEEETQNELLFYDLKLPELKDRERYEVTELCGEEEE